MNKRYKVLYMVNVPAPYMVNYFNELGKYCDLTVLFEKDTSTERDKSWKEYNFKNFKGIIMKGISTAPDMAFCPQIIFYLKKNKYDYIFVSNMTTPSGIIAIEYMKLRKMPYIMESEGGFAKDGKGFKEKLKKHLMTGAEWYFSTSPIGDDYFLKYGADSDKFVKYPFTSLYVDDIRKDIVSDVEKKKIREELGIKEEEVIVAVGQFIPRKGFDILIEAINNLDRNIGVYFIGGIPTEEYKKKVEQYGLTSVHFIGFKTKNELGKFYDAADLFVLPTREDIWGLVINEAMAHGLPVITTERCIAGVELVKVDENGYIVPIDDAVALRKRIATIFNDEENRKKFGRKSIEKIQWYTFESMAKVHMDFFEKN